MKQRVKAYNAYLSAATPHWAEIWAFAPLVFGQRLLATTTAGGKPTARQHAEMTRMVVEKGEALTESATALWLAAVEVQQIAWQRAWRSGRPAPVPADYALAVATARKLGQAWQPVSKRVRTNAKRLAARKRRRA